MKFVHKPFALLFLLVFSASLSFGQGKDSLYILYKAKLFNELNDHNKRTDHTLYFFYKAVFANVCNKPALSNTYLDQFIKKVKTPPKLVGYEYWTVRNDNYVKLFDYKNAYATLQKLLTDFKDEYDKSEYIDEQDNLKIWKSLIGQKAQTLTRSGSAMIPLTRDIAGLINFKVSANNLDTNFVFDTGAGMSSITESLAKSLNFKILPDTGIKVAGFSGVYNPVRIAVAEELKIGNLIIRNEPFLVFRDEAFSFAGGAYKINGIIGFPIAKEMGTITVTPDHLQVDEIILADSTMEKNLFVDLLRPVIFMKYKGKTLPFNFDTGAGASQFSKTFYDEYGKELEKSGKFQTTADASAGGARSHQSLLVKNVKFGLGEKEINFPEIEIDIENYHVSDRKLYGNIGQDLLKPYKHVTISFNGNYLKLEN